jgi:hypothetical protein
MEPMRSSMPRTLAGTEVATVIASSAGMPASTMSSNSFQFSPCGETPVSVPNRIGTPRS